MSLVGVRLNDEGRVLRGIFFCELFWSSEQWKPEFCLFSNFFECKNVVRSILGWQNEIIIHGIEIMHIMQMDYSSITFLRKWRLLFVGCFSCLICLPITADNRIMESSDAQKTISTLALFSFVPWNINRRQIQLHWVKLNRCVFPYSPYRFHYFIFHR